MVVGLIGLAMIIGVVSAGFALAIGHSLLMALLVYSVVGFLTVLTSAIALYVASEMQPQDSAETCVA